jgi:hypothetical protein
MLGFGKNRPPFGAKFEMNGKQRRIADQIFDVQRFSGAGKMILIFLKAGEKHISKSSKAFVKTFSQTRKSFPCKTKHRLTQEKPNEKDYDHKPHH